MKCPYCKKNHKTRRTAEPCLNNSITNLRTTKAFLWANNKLTKAEKLRNKKLIDEMKYYFAQLTK